MVVVDSSILIHLSRIGQLKLLRYFDKVTVTPEVQTEVVFESGRPEGIVELRQALGDWIIVTKPKAKNIGKISRLGGIEEADASIIILAKEQKDFLLTNDRTLIQFARSMKVECWWMTTILLKLVKDKKIRVNEAEDILFNLVKTGMRLKIEVYTAILSEIKRMK